MKSEYLSNRNARIFLFQYLLSNLFIETSFEQLKEAFWFDNDKIDQEKVMNFIKLYEQKKDEIESILPEDVKKTDSVTIAIIKLGILLMFSGEQKKLTISECLKISDIFRANTAFVNKLLESISNSVAIN